MAVSMTSKFDFKLAATMSEALDLQSRSSAVEYAKTISLASGVAANQADKVWSDERTVAQGGGEDLDLVATLTDVWGAALTIVKLKAILIEADAANTMLVNVTYPAADGVPFLLAAGDGVSIPAGGCFAYVAPGLAGICTVGGASSLIHVASSGAASVTYKIILIGTSA